MAGDRYSQYDTFAWFYNRHWGGFAERIMPVLERLVLPAVPDGARVLDICCGTGQLARILTVRGYRVTGIDGSEEMLRYARMNAPGASFVVADARSFVLPAEYRAAVSLFDSLNHVMGLDELRAVFSNVYAALVPGGTFLFDLNVENGFRARWRGSFGIAEDDNACVVRNRYDPDTKVGRSDITMFRPGAQARGWRRSDLTLLQQCHAEDAVRVALEGARFREIRAFDALTDLNMPDAADWAAGRAFFLARRPEK